MSDTQNTHSRQNTQNDTPRPAKRRSGKPRGYAPRPKKSTPRNARDVAFNVMTGIQERDAYANLLLPKALDNARFAGRDRAFATDLVYGTLRWMRLIDAIIETAARRSTTTIDPPVMTVLRLGVYQALWMDVPAHAAVSETVNQAKRHTRAGAAGFVNAIMRRVAEKTMTQWQETVTAVIPARQTATRLGTAWSHPDWIVRTFDEAWNEAGYKPDDNAVCAMLKRDNEPPAVTLVARPGLITPDELAASLPDGAQADKGLWSPCAVRVHGVAPETITAVKDGRAGVEDEGSQLAALALAASPIEGADARWLDMCAGPGGKTALLGALAAQRGAQVVANEPSHHRAELVRRNVAALPQGAVAEVMEEDGRTLGERAAFTGGFDRVLVDAPCSGLGSLRRRPEARWHKTPDDVAELVPLQKALLESAVRCVRVGGVVAYVTCSPCVAETRRVVDDVLAKHYGEVERLDAAAVLRGVNGNIPLPENGGDVQLFAHVHDTDQMFVSLMRRVA